MMETGELTRADLTRKLGFSRARATQILNLLKLPPKLKDELEALGDYWETRLVTKRCLRGKTVCIMDELM